MDFCIYLRWTMTDWLRRCLHFNLLIVAIFISTVMATTTQCPPEAIQSSERMLTTRKRANLLHAEMIKIVASVSVSTEQRRMPQQPSCNGKRRDRTCKQIGIVAFPFVGVTWIDWITLQKHRRKRIFFSLSTLESSTPSVVIEDRNCYSFHFIGKMDFVRNWFDLTVIVACNAHHFN